MFIIQKQYSVVGQSISYRVMFTYKQRTDKESYEVGPIWLWKSSASAAKQFI